ncbi:MAG: non-canonical purine NTP pyrophosphatase [Candidatus Peribacteraceae bacterium]|jgi:XTP/dITP diphosphohydrolase|nr:non-canonical purine NTP pyrophosphatase [Candidatus Peribacteraceae bacterium]
MISDKSQIPTKLATSNEKKADEWSRILESVSGNSTVERFQDEFHLVFTKWTKDSEPTQGEPYRVIIAKALEAFDKNEEPVLVEEAFLEIERLGGYPGVHYAWQQSLGTTNADYCRLLNGEGNKRATASIASAFINRDRSEALVNIVGCSGAIANEPRGENGFGFDDIFIPGVMQQTLSELPEEEKDSISMRRTIIIDLLNGRASHYPIGKPKPKWSPISGMRRTED